MCHVLLLLPFIVLPAFWLWPLEVAVPLYAAVSVASLAVYLLAWKAWKTPPANGPQTLIGATGRVVRVGTRDVTLLLGGELWTADVDGMPLALGERAVVVAIEGLRLTARSTIQDASGQ